MTLSPEPTPTSRTAELTEEAERTRIDAFLGCRRIALVGVSRDPQDFSRMVMKALLDRGIDVVPVNPDAASIGELRAFGSVAEIEGPPVEGALVMTPPSASAGVMLDCALAGIRRVWLHRGAGVGSVSDEAVRIARMHRIELVAGRCPLMFLGEHPDLVHRVHAGALRLGGRYPERAGVTPASTRRRVIATVGYGAAGWAAGALAFALVERVAPLGLALVLHGLIAPLAFVPIAFAYQRLSRHLAPLPAAAAFAAVWAVLHVEIVGDLVLGRLDVVLNPLATWLPLAAIFLASWAAGLLGRRPPRADLPRTHQHAHA